MKRTTLAFSILCLLLGLSAIPISAQDDQAIKMEDGKRMWEKWIEARGGRDRLSKIREIKTTSEMIAQGVNRTYVSYSKGVDKYRLDQKEMGITTTVVVPSPTDASCVLADPLTGLYVDMPKRTRERFLAEREKHEELLNPEKYGQTITYEGRRTINGKEYILLKQAAGNGAITMHYIDPDTFLRYKFTSNQLNGIEVITSDYRDVDGTKVSFLNKMILNGNEVATKTFTRYEYNCGLDDSLFAKPQ